MRTFFPDTVRSGFWLRFETSQSWFPPKSIRAGSTLLRTQVPSCALAKTGSLSLISGSVPDLPVSLAKRLTASSASSLPLLFLSYQAVTALVTLALL
jgi:hypothetical protein